MKYRTPLTAGKVSSSVKPQEALKMIQTLPLGGIEIIPRYLPVSGGTIIT